jgi:hypothetical protein
MILSLTLSYQIFNSTATVYASSALASETKVASVPILRVAGTRRPLNWVQDSPCDFSLNLLAEIGTYPGCLIVIESDATRLFASPALLQKDKDS